MKTRKSPLLWGFAGFLLLTLIDQCSKYFAVQYLSGTSGFSLIPGVFELFYLENHGAAFGIMKDQQWFFILIALIMLIFTCYIFIKLPKDPYYDWLHLICILIASGAVGNMIDRIIHRYVIDFLYFSLIDFPVFNIADCYVCVGAALAVILIFTLYKEEEFEFLIPGRNSRF